MRYIIFNDIIVGGGAEVVMHNITQQLLNKGNKVLIISTDIGKNYSDDCKKIYGTRCKYVPYYFGWSVKSNRSIIRFIQKIIWNSFLLINSLFLQDKLIVTKVENFPYGILRYPWKEKYGWVHADFNYISNKEELKNWLSPQFKLFNKVICVSEAAKNSAVQIIGDTGNIVVAYNPINFKSIQRNATKHNTIQRNEAIPLFVAIGRMVECKNFITLANVCARLSKEFDFELWIVGDGEQRSDIEHILNEAECSCVKLVGMQDNPYKYLKKADVLVSTSLGESYGLVIQEALILGVPVLSTRCPAIEECFDTRFGMLVDCNEEAIENGMRYILEHPECIDRFKSAIQNEYDVESLWDGRLKAIEDLLG